MNRDISDEEIRLISKQLEVVKIINNALYFKDNTDYETALWQAMSALTGIDYSTKERADLTYLEDQTHE